MAKIEETLKDILDIIWGTEPKKRLKGERVPYTLSDTYKKRARDKRGRYKGDDKSTKDVNEAWIGGKAPKKKV